MRAMILAAGLGTRLAPLTQELPKPLVPVGDRPAVAHLAARLAAGGVTEAVLNTHHLSAAFSRLTGLPLALRVVHEAEILGTAGGVANAAALLGEGDVIVWNGDVLADVDVAALAGAHRIFGAAATLAAAPREAGEGTLGVDTGGRVVRLRGERFGAEARGADFLGVQILGGALRAGLPARGCLAGDVYLPALRRGVQLATFAVPGPWDDIGTLGAYLAANARWLARAGLASYVGEGARVDGRVDVAGSVIGAGAVVRGPGPVTRSVVWPGAKVEGPLDGAVVTKGGVVVRG